MIYLILELMDFSLDCLLWNNNNNNNFKLNTKQKIEILLDISNGMKFIHENKILHRDLKSLNILIKKENNNYKAKLCDLGNAIQKKSNILTTMSIKLKDDSFKLDTLRNYGTILWSPYEVLIKNKIYSPKSDSYSFGIYEILK
jgi:serine/threonine protein kinase